MIAANESSGMSTLNIGTCSWKYDSWRGIVYSDDPRPNYLREYAQRYSTVEIDQWFWSLFEGKAPVLPDPRTVEEYAAAVGGEFTFSVKVPNSITLTHFYRKSKTDPLVTNPFFLSLELFETFLEGLRPLHDRLGPLMFQYEYLNRQKMPSAREFRERFAEFIESCPEEYLYALELRNPNYFEDAHFRFLNEHRVQHVFLQGYYMPPIYGLYEKFKRYIKGGTVIRLHGSDRKGIEKSTGKQWNRIVAAKDDEISDLITMLRELTSNNIATYLNVNNHYEGSAPLTIEKIKAQL